MTKYSNDIYVGPSAPANPYPTLRWYDTINDLWKRWNGSAWVVSGDTRYSTANSFVFNLKPKHLFRTRAKLGAVKAGAGVVKISTLGHSMVAGTGAAPGVSDWPTVLRSFFVNAGFPSAGTGLVGMNRGSSLASLTDARWSFGSGWTLFGGSSSLGANSTTTNAATFSSDASGTRVEVSYHNGGGPFNVSIDGGTAVLVTPSGGSSTGVYAVSGLANTTHTVAISRISGNVIIFGVEVWNGVTGIRLYNGGIAGQLSSAIADTNYYSTTTWAGLGSGWNSDLAFLECITNDAFAATAIATFTSQTQTAITQLKANGQDVILVADTPVSGLDQSAYVNAYYALALSNDIPLIDMGSCWTSYALASTYGIMSDGTHANAAGYASQARAVFSALGL